MEKVLIWILIISGLYCFIYDCYRLSKDYYGERTARYLLGMVVWFFGLFICFFYPIKDRSKPIHPKECFVLSDKDSSVVIFKYGGERVYVKDSVSIKTNSYDLSYKSYYNFMGLEISNSLVYKKKD